MLCRHADGGAQRGGGAQGMHERRHFDGLGTGAKYDEDVLHAASFGTLKV